MYTDWTAIALLLFTAVPLLIVVATATYFMIQNDQKTPWAEVQAGAGSDNWFGQAGVLRAGGSTVPTAPPS